MSVAHSDVKDGVDRHIVEVWADNLETEFNKILQLVDRYPYVALDTEFPGIVAHPSNPTGPDYNYRTVKCNVDLLKVIQLGITFADERGSITRTPATWQFNFKFDMACDMYAQDSIEFLRSSGVDFEKLQSNGIGPQDFGELMMASGLVMNENINWISFHGCYDFGYLLKLLTCAPLPQAEIRFNELLRDFFPSLYDVKCLLKDIPVAKLSGCHSLHSVSKHLGVKRVGQQHQAGSDSLVTCRSFFRLVEIYFSNKLDKDRYSGIIYGLHVRKNRNPTNENSMHHRVKPVPYDEDYQMPHYRYNSSMSYI